MKTASAGLRAILAKQSFDMADCYTIITQSGFTARFTTADKDITESATGYLFSSSGPRFQRSKFKWNAGVQVDTLEVTLGALTTDMFNGTPWMHAIQQGLLDGAEFVVQRAFMSTFGDTTNGLLTMFRGLVSETTVDRLTAVIKVNTHLDLLSQNMPRRIYQPGCKFSLFDVNCGLVKSSFATLKTCGAGGSATLMIITGYAAVTGYHDLGTGTFVTGAMTGQQFSIKSHTLVSGDAQIVPLVPFGSVPDGTMTVNLYPGCDKLQATCTTKFSNLINFGGYPYVPAAETSV
jgi:uncharacterized phage protein (TIGR02218 family)